MSLNNKLNEVAQYVCDKYPELEFDNVTLEYECVNDICQSFFGRNHKHMRKNIVKALTIDNSELRKLICVKKNPNESVISLNDSKVVIKIAKCIEDKKYIRNDFVNFNSQIIDDICRHLKMSIYNSNRRLIFRHCNQIFNEISSYMKDNSVNVTTSATLDVQGDLNTSIVSTFV